MTLDSCHKFERLEMIIVSVTFKIPKSLEPSALKEKFMETAPIYRDTLGLLRKNYIYDFKNRTAGGIYCFDTLQNAKTWFNAERLDWIADRYSKPAIRFFENPVIVDNESGDIIS